MKKEYVSERKKIFCENQKIFLLNVNILIHKDHKILRKYYLIFKLTFNTKTIYISVKFKYKLLQSGILNELSIFVWIYTYIQFVMKVGLLYQRNITIAGLIELPFPSSQLPFINNQI